MLAKHRKATLFLFKKQMNLIVASILGCMPYYFVIGGADYKIADGDYIIAAADYIIAGCDYNIYRQLANFVCLRAGEFFAPFRLL